MNWRSNKEKELWKINRNMCVTHISNPANGEKIHFEIYNYIINEIIEVLLHNLIEC
jgi:hypothetical protein